MAPSAALTSDHVNYLIFRYLQEAGHENTATAFYRDWHRTAEFRDPEKYPFAPVVRRNELVSIIQSGLRHDELEARVTKHERRFRLTRVSSSRDALAADRSPGAILENGTAGQSATGSRPGSSAKRKGRLSAVRAQVDFPTPAPKRLRRSEDRQLNGDVMDVDAASPSAAEADEDGEAVSPAVVSEPEMLEIPERYDSMDVAVQTETTTGPKTSTMYWKIDRPRATIYHSVFNPASDSGSANTLMTVGESLCRFYQVPESLEQAQQVLSVDEPTLPLNSVVTASAWHPKGHVAAFAADTIRDLPDGAQTSQQAVFSHNSDTGEHVQYAVPPLLDPQGIVLALRYNHMGNRLLVLRTNLKRSLILVYNTDHTGIDKTLPIAWSIYEHQVLDAAWLTASEYVVVGEGGFARLAHVDEASAGEPTGNLTASEIRTFHLSHSEITLPEAEQGRNFDKVRVSSPNSGDSVVIFASSQESALIVTHRPTTESATGLAFVDAVQSDEPFTAMAFQPLPDVAASTQPALIAIASEDGDCVLYSYTPSPDEKAESQTNERFRELLKLYFKDGPPLALAWSPDGAFLAVAGIGVVQIWEVNSLIRREERKIERKTDAPPKALVTWRPDPNALGSRNGEHEEPRTLSEPSLSWSADGLSLGFAVQREVAIIRFRPPLGRRDEKIEVNGHVSP